MKLPLAAVSVLLTFASLAAASVLMPTPVDEKQLVEFYTRENLTFTILVHYPPPEVKSLPITLPSPFEQYNINILPINQCTTHCFSLT